MALIPMQKSAFFLLFLFFQHCALATDIEVVLTGLPDMAPENCASQSPDELLDKLLAKEPRPEWVGGCEACIDRFYEAYAIQLAKKTDVDDPATKRLRPLLLASFESCFEYLVQVHHTNGTNHYGNRISAEVEWIIYCGTRKQYHETGAVFGGRDILSNAWLDDESDYAPGLIRQIGTAIGRANASPLDHFDQNVLPILRRGLRQLAQAEKTMKDEDEKSYFRRYLVLFLTRFP